MAKPARDATGATTSKAPASGAPASDRPASKAPASSRPTSKTPASAAATSKAPASAAATSAARTSRATASKATSPPVAAGANVPSAAKVSAVVPVAARAIGIDIGGTGVKAGVVDLELGELISPRLRRPTPQPSTPEAVLAVAGLVIDDLIVGGWATAAMPAGCGLPGVVKHGRLTTAANIDQGWVNAPVEQMLADRLGRPVAIGNDADVAGMAELLFGAARGHSGTVLMLTLGTGIGSALFVDGRLVPNTEFGHLQFHGKDAEKLLSATARERRGLSWKRWAKDFNQFLAQVELYFGPDLIILGGGGSKVFAKYASYLTTRAPIVTARLLNSAGIVGAALLGHAAADDGTASLPAMESSPEPESSERQT